MRLLLRGLWFHRGTSAVLLLAATLTFAAATAGPLWGNASEQSVLIRAVQGRPPTETSLVVSGLANSTASHLSVPRTVRAVQDDVRSGAVLPAGLDHRFDEPQVTLTTLRQLAMTPLPGPEPGGTSREPESLAPLGRLMWRDGVCENVDITAGRCPEGGDELLLSERSVTALGLDVGGEVRIDDLADQAPPAGHSKPIEAYTISGVYDAATTRSRPSYWLSTVPAEFSPEAVLGGDIVPARLDAVFVSYERISSLQQITVRGVAERPLLPERLPLGVSRRVAADLREHLELAEAVGGGTRHESGLLGVLDEVERERALIRTSALLVSGQVVLIGWVVLLVLVAASVAAREAEVALAKLRGMPAHRVGLAALGEPAAVLALAVPLGMLTGFLVVDAFRGDVLADDVRLALSRTTALSVAGAALGVLVAAVLAAYRSMRSPVADQLRHSGAPLSAGGGSVVDAVVVALAVAATSVVATLGRDASGATLGLLMPTIVGVAAGLLLARLVLLAARLLLRARDVAHLPLFLAVRQVGRRATTVRATAVLTATVTFVGFAAASWVMAAEQRADQAALDVGAERVIEVAAVPPARLLEAVAAADPEGDWAMAAVHSDPGRGQGVDRVLAVDVERFGRVATPGPQGPLLTADDVAALGSSTVAPSLVVRGSAWELDVDLVQEVSQLQLAVVVRVDTAAGRPVNVGFGRLDGGPQTLAADVPACAAGCRVSRVALVRVPGSTGPMAGALRLEQLRVGGRPVDAFAEQHWRPLKIDETAPESSSPSAELDVQGGGLLVQFALPGYASTGVARRDVPESLVAVVGSATPLDRVGVDGLVEGSSLGDAEPTLRVRDDVPALPRLGAEGVLVDLALLGRVAPADRAGLVHQVWLGPQAPASAVRELEATGLEVLGRESVAGRRTQLDRQGPALALVLLLLAAATVLLAGLAAVTTSLASQNRRRAVESAALRALGVPDHALRRAVHLEHVAVLGPAVLLGAACGGLAAVLSVEVLRSASSTAGAVPAGPGWASTWVPVAATAALTAVLLWALSLAAGRMQVSAARVDKLKEAQA